MFEAVATSGACQIFDCAQENISNYINPKARYTEQYREMVVWCAASSGQHKDLTFQTILALAVYGWMPTIPKGCLLRSCPAVLAGATTVSTHQSAKDYLEQFDANCGPINGSWVASSKFFHFLNPTIFPIWDSRVAAAFNLKHRYQFGNRKAYQNYVCFLHGQVPKRTELIKKAREALNYDAGFEISAIRALELVLFGKHKTGVEDCTE